MSKIKELIKGKKQKIDEVQAPDNMTDRLMYALDKKILNYKKNNWKPLAAIGIIIILLTGYNFDTLAYLGKKLVGYDTIMNGTLKELNQLEKGQVIGKSYVCKNGVEIILDGVMLDDNQLLAFYSVKDPKGNVQSINLSNINIKGILSTNYMEGGHGVSNYEETEIKWIMSFGTPQFFEKKMKFEFVINEGNKHIEAGYIPFELDRNKAMGHSLKSKIDKRFKIETAKIYIDSILASPTSTVIKGNFADNLNGDYKYGEYELFKDFSLILMANGEMITSAGGGMSSGINGFEFHKEYDALPEEIESLQLILNKVPYEEHVSESVDIGNIKEEKMINIHNNRVIIKNVMKKDGKTYVTINTKEDVLLTDVSLLVDNKKVDLDYTNTEKHNKEAGGLITHTRTLVFNDTGNELELLINKIKYTKDCNEVIDIIY